MLDKNKDILAERFPHILILLDEIEEEQSDIEIISAQNNLEIVKFTVDDHEWFLNSKIDPQKAAEIYVERLNIRIYGKYFLFGFSDGRVVRTLLKKCDDTNGVVICEPNIRIFKKVCDRIDISDILADERIEICFSNTKYGPERIMGGVVQYNNIRVIECAVLPGYDILYRDECEQFDEAIGDQMRREHVHRATRMAFLQLTPRSTMYHMKRMITQNNPYQLKKKLEEYNLKKIPAIIVSAGPSLDKNVEQLKAAQGKALIIVVDAALRTVIQAGIRPDLVYTVDPESPDRFFEGMELKTMNWVCERITRPEIVMRYAERIMYTGYYMEQWNLELKELLGYEFPEILSGGSVTTEAFMMALYLGFTKIILVGQDMAFTNGVSHTKGINKAFGDNDEYINSRIIMKVEGINGETLETDFQMYYYKKWFEQIIASYDEQIEVIDATEGGARIEGTSVETLNNAIIENCKENLNVYEIVRGLPPMLSEEQQAVLKGRLFQLYDDLPNMREKLQEICTKQRAIKESLYKEPGVRIKEKFAEVQKDIDNIKDTMLMEFFVLYAQEEEYEVGEDIYVQEKMKLEEIIEKSLKLFKGYLKASELFASDFQKYVLENK